MAINSFECPICKKRTKHCTISGTEFMQSKGDSTGIKFLTGLMGPCLEISGKFANLVGQGFKPYKCMDCGVKTLRDSAGEFDSLMW